MYSKLSEIIGWRLVSQVNEDHVIFTLFYYLICHKFVAFYCATLFMSMKNNYGWQPLQGVVCIEAGTDFRNLEGTTTTSTTIVTFWLLLVKRTITEILLSHSERIEKWSYIPLTTHMHAETNAVTHMHTYQWRIEYSVNYSLKGSEDTKA